MDYTQYLHLSKPDIATDRASVNDLNANMDTIDEAIHDIETSGSGDTVLQKNQSSSSIITHATGYLQFPLLLSHTEASDWLDHSELQDSSVVVPGLLGGDSGGTLYATDVVYAQDNGYFDGSSQYRSLAEIANSVAALSSILAVTSEGLSISSDVSISGDVATSGSISSQSITATNDLNADGQLHVTHEGYFADKIVLDATPTTQINGYPEFLGAAVFDDTVTFNDDVTFMNLSALTVGDLTATNNISSVDAYFSGNVTFDGEISANMNFSMGYYPYVNEMPVVGIEANPSDIATDTLTSVNIDGTVYDIGGGGGSSVTPNPQGTPTDTLSTIEIDGTVFDIEGSGGTYSETTLWSGEDSATMTLSESFENYDAIMVVAEATSNNIEYSISAVWLTSYLSDHINDGMRFGLTGDSWYIYFSISDSTTFERQDQSYLHISEIKGLKLGGGAGSEIIPISAGDNTTSRTFTFDKTPKFIKFYWDDLSIEGTGWVLDAQLAWGQPFMDYLAHARYVGISQGSGACASVSYGVDGKSITITGGNAFGAMNTSAGTGYMFVDYGGGGANSAKKDMLYNNPNGAPHSTDLALTHNIFDYDIVVLTITNPTDISDFNAYTQHTISPMLYENGQRIGFQGLYGQRVVEITLASNGMSFKVVRVSGDYQNNTVYKILGIKY